MQDEPEGGYRFLTQDEAEKVQLAYGWYTRLIMNDTKLQAIEQGST
jgi:hypothetical protein